MENNIKGTTLPKIDIMRFVKALVRKSWIMVALAIVFGAYYFIRSAYFTPPSYQTSFTAYVNNKTTENANGTSTNKMTTDIKLARLYAEIIISRSAIMDAAERQGINGSYGWLKSMVSINISDGAGLMTVYVTGTNPETITKFAKGIAEVAPSHVERVVDGTAMRIIDEPLLPTSKFAPNNTQNTIPGLAIGFVLGAVLIIALELFNDKVQDAQDLENRYNIAIVGAIPDIVRAEKSRGRYGYRYSRYKYGYYKYSYKNAYKEGSKKGGNG